MSVDPLAPLFALFQRPWTRAVDQRRRALIARAPSLARVIDRSDAMHARMLPLEANEAAEILADVTMITTVEIVFLPAANLSPTVAEESAAVSQELSAQAEEASSVVKRLMDLVGTDARDLAGKAAEQPARKSVTRMARAKTKPAATTAAPTPAEQIPFEESTGTYGGF